MSLSLSSSPSLPLGSAYILLIRRYRVTSGSTLPAKMAPSPMAAATSNKIFICQVSLLSPVTGVITFT
jgi:hypothetical protein